ncbi:hypothetical protein BGW38_003577 [Lunasporangiospora selenospora]|uniref:Uncharacterized protein n=1 Tax=Lunasporangiospora selenospora TaxID=979761 RepID=A0A9P6KCR3_9FUNG|nr:hypothetical protein BGW38_003577 [Lunasporangiospora selenospora]
MDYSDDVYEELGQVAAVEAFNARSESSDLMQMAKTEAMRLIEAGGGKDKNAVLQSATATVTKIFMSKSDESGSGDCSNGGLASILVTAKQAFLGRQPS